MFLVANNKYIISCALAAYRAVQYFLFIVFIFYLFRKAVSLLFIKKYKKVAKMMMAFIHIFAAEGSQKERESTDNSYSLTTTQKLN